MFFSVCLFECLYAYVRGFMCVFVWVGVIGRRVCCRDVVCVCVCVGLGVFVCV